MGRGADPIVSPFSAQETDFYADGIEGFLEDSLWTLHNNCPSH